MTIDEWSLYRYRGRALAAVDGDTLRVALDLGLHVSITVDLRLIGVDAPEIVGEHRAAGIAAREALWARVVGRTLFVATHKDRRSFARYLADVYVDDGDGTLTKIGESDGR